MITILHYFQTVLLQRPLIQGAQARVNLACCPGDLHSAQTNRLSSLPQPLQLRTGNGVCCCGDFMSVMPAVRTAQPPCGWSLPVAPLAQERCCLAPPCLELHEAKQMGADLSAAAVVRALMQGQFDLVYV